MKWVYILLMSIVAQGFDLEDYATTYRATRDAYLKAANELKLATGPYKAARDAYVAATATYTKSLYERRRLENNVNMLSHRNPYDYPYYSHAFHYRHHPYHRYPYHRYYPHHRHQRHQHTHRDNSHYDIKSLREEMEELQQDVEQIESQLEEMQTDDYQEEESSPTEQKKSTVIESDEIENTPERNFPMFNQQGRDGGASYSGVSNPVPNWKVRFNPPGPRHKTMWHKIVNSQT